jgi:trehalose 6-phosphate phosphatase
MSDLLDSEMEPVLRTLAQPGTLVVLDFDGTLAPIVRAREDAALSARTIADLTRLAERYPVAVLSGRGAEDVRARLAGVAVTWIVGSHGAEWPGEEGQHEAWRALVEGWRAALRLRLADLPGVEIEAKALSLTVHYRRSPAPSEALGPIIEAAVGLPGVHLVLGKRVVNLLPIGAGDKGTALQRLVALAGAARLLFVGDDVTDEAAFGALLPIPSVMVRVGRAPGTLAAAWLRRQSDVDLLLERLVDYRTQVA